MEIAYQLAEIAASVIEIIIMINFVTQFLSAKYQNRIKNLAQAGTVVLLSGMVLLSNSFLEEFYVELLYVWVILFLYELFFLEGSIGIKIVMPFGILTMIYMINSITLSALCWCLDVEMSSLLQQSGDARIIVLILTKLFFWFGTQCMLSLKKNKAAFTKKDCCFLALVLGITAYVEVTILQIGTFYNPDGKYKIQMLMCCVLLGVLNGVIFLMICIMNKKNEEKVQAQFLIWKQQELLKDMESMRENYLNVKSLKHDMKNYLSSIDILLENGRYEEAQIYIEEIIQNKAFTKDMVIVSGNSYVDAMVNAKKRLCEQKHMMFRFEILGEIEEHMGIPISGILGNLLDNAIEACEKNKTETYINVMIKRKHNWYQITVENSMESTVLKKNPELLTHKTDKEQHGWGLKSVKSIVKDYNGSISMEEKDNRFIVDVLLFQEED